MIRRIWIIILPKLLARRRTCTACWDELHDGGGTRQALILVSRFGVGLFCRRMTRVHWFGMHSVKQCHISQGNLVLVDHVHCVLRNHHISIMPHTIDTFSSNSFQGHYFLRSLRRKLVESTLIGHQTYVLSRLDSNCNPLSLSADSLALSSACALPSSLCLVTSS